MKWIVSAGKTHLVTLSHEVIEADIIGKMPRQKSEWDRKKDRLERGIVKLDRIHEGTAETKVSD